MKSKRLLLVLTITAACEGIIPCALSQPRPLDHTGHVPQAIARLHLEALGRLPQTNRLHLAIGLPLRHQEVLTNLLQELYDPASPNYRHYLKPGQFAERFGPTEADYDSVVAFLQTNGWAVTRRDPCRMLVQADAAVLDVERVCHVQLRTYQHPAEGRTFFAPDTEPALDLATPVLDISGLDDFVLPHSAELVTNPETTATPPVGSGPGGNLMGYDFRRAYASGVSLDGSGQVVGLVAFNGFFTNDILAYEAMTGLPNISVVFESVDGYDGTPDLHTNTTVGEVSLDIEMVISMAPGLSRLIVYEAPPRAPGNDILAQMANDNTAAQISCSYLFPPNATTANYFQRFAAQGQSFFIASGDFNAYTNGVTWGGPADYPYVTSVGGTILTAGPKGFWVSETAWDEDTTWGSGGGISTAYPIPDWQKGTSMATNGGSTTMRNLPDVAMPAQNIFTIANNGATLSSDGTSCAAPLWAGFAALVNQQAAALGNGRIGFINPALYRLGNSAGYSAAFHDITTGNNTNASSHNLFRAMPGYDLCTGWGTPKGMNLINALTVSEPLFISPADGFTAAGTVGGPFNVTNLTFCLTNFGSNSLSWSVSSDSTLLSASPSSGILPDSGSTTILVSLTTNANGIAVGLYCGNLLFSNRTLGTEQIRQFTIQAGLPPLTFDDLVHKAAVPEGYGGLSWSNFYAYNCIIGVTPFYGVPMLSPSNVIYNGWGSPALITNTAPFDLLSAEVASVFCQNMNLEVQGHSGANLTYDRNFTLNGIVPAAVQFDCFGVTSVAFISSGGYVLRAGGGEQFSMDNVLIISHDTAAIRPQLEQVAQSGGVTAFAWAAQLGQTYQVQSTTTLSPVNWSNLGSPLTTGNYTFTFTDTSTNQQTFYRVLVLP
jgi:hypothetical protein